MLLGQTGDPTDVVSNLIVGAGVAGIWLVTIITGKMHPESSMARERARADKAEAKVDELTGVYITEVIPALNNAVAAIASTHASRRHETT